MNIAGGNMPILISVSVFVSSSLLFFGILYYFKQRAKGSALRRKIGQGEESDLTSRKNQPNGTGVMNFLGSLGKRIAPEKSVDYSRMRLSFLRAGIWSKNIYHAFWGIRILLGILLPGIFLVLRVGIFEIMNVPLTIAFAVSLVFVGLYLPDLWLRMRISKRKEKIKDGFANVIDLLIVCVEAGMGLDSAINRVGQEIGLSNKAWGDELKLYNLELRGGMLRRDALKHLALRTDIEDIGSLVTSLIEADKFGTSLGQSLRVYSESFRTKCYQKAEEIASKLPVKLVFPAICFIFPSLFVALVGPAAIRVYQILLQP